MGQILHGCARTTKEIRLQIQRSKENITELSKRFYLNRNTVRKWKNRDFTHDAARVRTHKIKEIIIH